MSIKATKWAMEQPIHRTPKSVLMVLANHADKHMNECWPSLATLAKETSLSRRTVLYSLQYLEDVGFISSSKRLRDNGSNSSKSYQLVVSDVCSNPISYSEWYAYNGSRKPSTCTPPSASTCTPPVHLDAPPINERSGEGQKEPLPVLAEVQEEPGADSRARARDEQTITFQGLLERARKYATNVPDEELFVIYLRSKASNFDQDDLINLAASQAIDEEVRRRSLET